jgi:uncharacterized protein
VAHLWTGLDRHYRLLRMRARRWLDRHPRMDHLLRSSGALSTRDGAIARGVAVGLFVALLPLFGVQTLLIAVVCIAARGNFPAAFAVSWVNNPLTVAPLYLAFNAIGERFFSGLLRPLVALTGWEREVVLEAMYLGSGALCVAIPAAVLGYMLAYRAERSLRNRHAARRSPEAGRLRDRRR